MSNRIDINVKHITRVEGHGNIVVRASDGKIEKCEWQVPEAPRFFEAMVRGLHFEDIQIVASRICGICSITHSLAATKALEAALGAEVSKQSDTIRILMHYSEQLQSHVLHIGYLVAPNLFGMPSVVPLLGKAPDAVKTIVRTHRLANEWSDLIAGRTTHPVTIKPGGLTMIPNEEQFRTLQQKLKASVADLATIVDIVASVADKLPKFERPTEYVSLVQKDPATYTFYHGSIGTTDVKDLVVPVSDWTSVANEYVVAQSTAKWAKWHRDTYAVGALARFNNNSAMLSPLAKSIAKKFNLQPGCCNPFMNSIAQLVETAHVVEISIQMIDELLTKGLKKEKVSVKPRAGKGSGCVEAPRGILFHTYELDKNGRCTAANMCIPTNQNHANIQKDIEKFTAENLSLGQDGLRLGLEMLVRSYDPCISCSTHAINVEFV